VDKDDLFFKRRRNLIAESMTLIKKGQYQDAAEVISDHVIHQEIPQESVYLTRWLKNYLQFEQGHFMQAVQGYLKLLVDYTIPDNLQKWFVEELLGSLKQRTQKAKVALTEEEYQETLETALKRLTIVKNKAEFLEMLGRKY
jgi:hypothetical protein